MAQIGPNKDKPNNFYIEFHRFEAEIGLHGSQKELHGSQKELEDLSIKKWESDDEHEEEKKGDKEEYDEL